MPTRPLPLPRLRKALSRGCALIALVAGALLIPAAAGAQPSEAVIEIDPGAETILDARAVRRQVALELSEIDVPSFGPAGAPVSAAPPLFVRVLGRADRQVEVELWARGELSGHRVVSGAESGQHLLVRRVGLAAAELARRLRQKRIIAERTRQRQLAELRALAERNARRTAEGPLALRAEAFGGATRDFGYGGSGLSAEVTLRRSFRIDVGGRLLSGFEPGEKTRLTWLELDVGPALRLHPRPRLDVDLAAFVGMASVHVSGVRSVDDIASQRDSWSARGGISLRLQPRLARWARLSIGAEGGLTLRPIPIELTDSRHESLGGFYAGGALGVVLTP